MITAVCAVVDLVVFLADVSACLRDTTNLEWNVILWDWLVPATSRLVVGHCTMPCG